MAWADGESSRGSEGKVLIVTLFDSSTSETDSAKEQSGVSDLAGRLTNTDGTPRPPSFLYYN